MNFVISRSLGVGVLFGLSSVGLVLLPEVLIASVVPVASTDIEIAVREELAESEATCCQRSRLGELAG